MESQALLNLRTVKDAYRVFCGEDPDDGTPVTQVAIPTLASALHFLEVGACATFRAYDPTVPEREKLEEMGHTIAKHSGIPKQFSLDSLQLSDPKMLQDCCSMAIADTAHVLIPLTASREAMASDAFHSPLRVQAPETVIAAWRRCFTSKDVTRDELVASVFSGKATFHGSKCVIGVLGNPDLAQQLSDLIVGAEDAFLLDHLIPVMIERFRIHFLPTLAATQTRTTVTFFDPRLAGLCEEHAEYVGTFLAREARGVQPERPDTEQFRLAFEAAPLALLALLTLPDNHDRPDSKRIFDRIVELREEIDHALGPRQFVAGQLRNELDESSRQRLDPWVQSLLPVSSPFEPLYCRVVKYGVPIVFTAGSSVIGAAGGVPGMIGGAALGVAAGTPVGHWLSEAINPQRKYNVALRSYAAIQGSWHRMDAANNLSQLVRAKVKSQLGLRLT